MKQYQRLVSYLYYYKKGQKGENVGYARVEQRGDRCRVTLQIRCRGGELIPKLYFFRRGAQGMEWVLGGPLQRTSAGYRCQQEWPLAELFQSESITNLDGLLISVNGEECFATTWKDVEITADDFRIKENEKNEEDRESKENEENEKSEENGEDKGSRENEKSEENEKNDKSDENKKSEENEKDMVKWKDNDSERKAEEPVQIKWEENESNESNASETNAPEEGQLEAQSICAGCPARNVDYGRRILCRYPVLHPFADNRFGKCVRLEPKDIGCLPIAAWSLAGNRFLLHGYYCYRHLIFTENFSGRYGIGVPGIYSDENKKQAAAYGFQNFIALSSQEETQGVFGYWMYPL